LRELASPSPAAAAGALPARRSATGLAAANSPKPGRMSGPFATVLAMRFLHTSDWHLGRSLHRADLRAAQAAFLDHLVETARSERVDAVLIAGDVYDRAIPPVDAVALYEDALARLRAAGARVILISGNHDSARRLGVNSALIDASGVHLRTRPAALGAPVLLNDTHGEIAVYGVPYLEPALAAPLLGDTALGDAALGDAAPGDPDLADPRDTRGPRSHASVLGGALGRIRADATGRGTARTVVLAHAWVTNGRDERERAEAASQQASASERDISVGGIGYVPAGLFDGFSYAALGHLHGRQTLAPHLRYSGSPLPYSFSEKDHRKGSWLVDIAADGTASADWVPAPVHRRLAVLTGRLDDLLAERQHNGREQDFLAVTLTDSVRPDGAMDRLRARFPHVLTLEFKPDGVTADSRSYGEKVRGRDDLAVAAEFVAHVRNSGPTSHERELLAAAFTAVRVAHDDGGR
jgi:DNA repair protein SbcD/Mre11